MLASFVITLREGLEASLIIGIVLAYLVRTGNRQGIKPVWLGTALAVVASLGVGAAIYIFVGELTGRAEELFEGSAMFLAVGVLTWMIFWMQKQAVNVRAHLHAQIRSALASDSALGLVALAFVAVTREGIETALFLLAASRVGESATLSTIGALLGLVVAVGIGYGMYKGSSRLNVRAFFNVTGLLLMLFAAGLLAHGIHEFHEAGLVPPVVEHVWDINRFLPEKSTFGRFLTALLGYNGNPSLVEVAAYMAFLVSTLVFYFRRTRTLAHRSPKSEMTTRLVGGAQERD